MIEFLWALIENFSKGAAILVALFSIVFVCCFVEAIQSETTKEHTSILSKWCVYCLIFIIIFTIMIIFPSPDDLFKIRLGLIKYELASPDNIKVGVDRINQVATELENKYLKAGDKK